MRVAIDRTWVETNKGQQITRLSQGLLHRHTMSYRAIRDNLADPSARIK